jgi:hypothetical protein
VPSSCPICEQPIPSTAAHCAVCGFPTALAIEGLRATDTIDTPEAGGDGDGGVVGAEAPPVVPESASMEAPSGEEDLAASISRDLRSKMDRIRELGRGPDVTADLCQAALIEAEGRIAEALEILRSAQGRLDVETDDLLQQRRLQLEERQRALHQTGVRFALGPDLERLTEAIESGDRAEAVTLLVEAERRVAQLESDWKGIQALLTQIEGLRNEAAELGFPLGEISGELEELRDRLRGPDITEESLDTFAQEAAQILMLLHEAIPASLESELNRTGTALDRFPEEHAPAAGARRSHLEASRHLKKGRLSEAIQSVRELRREITELEHAPAPPAEAPVAGTPQEEGEDAMLDRLLKKARSLAGRVRTLPPESETSREAAVQIREATELLRERRLKEADETLSRLMRMLSAEPPRT